MMMMTAPDKKENRVTHVLILIFLILSAGIIFAGYLNYTNYAMRHRSEVERQLSVIGDLKIAGLVQWRKERLGDAQVFYRNDVFSRLVRRCLETPEDPEVNRGLRSWLSNYQAYYQYDRILLLDTRYAKRLVVPDKPERANSFVSPSSSRILRSGKIAFEDFYRNEHDQKIYLKIIVPIFEGNGSSRMIAVLAFRIDPNTYLYPYINSWPTASETAETLLVRRDGNGVVFLNELRFQKNTALKLRFPLERLELPVVKAVLGRKGIVEGRDYRDEPVIAVVRAVPDSPWYISARMDISEMNAPLRERLKLLISLVAALLIGAGASVGLVWRQQRLRYYHEREEAAEALQASEEIYRRLVETANEAIYVAQDGMLKFVNRTTVEITGYSNQELTSMPFSKIIHPDDRNISVGRHLRRIKGEAVPDRNQCRIITRDGNIKWAEISGVLIEWEGKPATLNVLTDITERKQAEEALRQSEENFRRSLDESPLGVRIVTKEGETFYANRAILDIYGYDSVEELINTPVKKRYTPESYLEFQTRREQRRNGFEDPSEYVVSIIRKDGSIRHLQVYRKEILWNDKRQYQVLYSDITELKRVEEALKSSEEKYRNIFNTILEGIYRTTLEGRFVIINQAFAAICGYASPEEMMEKVTDIPNQLYANPKDRLQFQKRIAAEGKVQGFEVQFKHPTKGIIWVVIRSEAMRDEQGMIRYYDGTIEDITDRKRAEDELKQSYQQLRALAERLQQIREESQIVIAQEIHDELGGGLTGLKMDLSLLSQKITDEKAGKDHDFLMKRIHSSNQLIDRLIQNVRLIGTKLRPSVLDDLGLIAALEWESEEFAGRTGIQCEFVPAFEYVKMEETTATAVFRIFQEALTNVARHSGADKVTVLFREEGGYLYLEVIDNGRGITEGEILNMKSLGILGMRERAMVFGGKLSIFGEPGGGTTVVLKIPIGRGESR